MPKGRLRNIVVFGLSTALVACGGKDGPSGPPAVASVTVTSPSPSLEVGSTLLFSATAKDASGANIAGKTFAWESQSPAVATVDANGVVSGVSAGSSVIKATVDGKSGLANITVLPAPVAFVAISPRTPAVFPGASVQLTAIAQDAIGRTLAGRTITWSSANQALATVSNTGLVQGVASGSTYIIAMSEGRSDSVALRVRSINAPSVSGTGPAMWTPGLASASITGANFSLVPTENQVFVNGTQATVTSSTATALQITVPSVSQLPCSPTGPVPLIVVVNGDSAISTTNLTVAEQRSLAVGQSLELTSVADVRCNEFPVTGGRYLITAFNASRSSSDRVSFQLLGASRSSTTADLSLVGVPRLTAPAFGPLNTVVDDASRRVAAHTALLNESIQRIKRSRDLKGSLRARRDLARRGSPMTSSTARAAFGAGTASRMPPVAPPNVGDRVWKLMRRTFNQVAQFDSVRARVAYVGPKIIILEDTTNELFGQMNAEYLSIGAEFDQNMFGFLSSFGDPLALDSLTDNNGRVVALFTKRVNEFDLGNGGSLLGFVTSCDFFPQSDPTPGNACPSSNEGEHFYAFVPNESGTRGRFNLDTWKRYARGTMIHEMKHVVMFAERIARDADLAEETWLEEATAQQASELWAREHYGQSQGDDIRWDEGPTCDYAAVSGACPDPVEGIGHHFQFLYAHYENNEAKSFINSSDNVIYGSAWLFARWITDQFDNGNEATFLQQLVQQQNDRGITNVEARTGKQWRDLLAQFSMAAVADNNPGATITNPLYSIPSWNTRDVFAGMNANLVRSGSGEPAFPRAWPLNVRTPAFGNFSIGARNVTSLPGGGFVAWEVSGTQTQPQVLALRATNGGVAPSSVGMVILRVQ